MNLFRSTAVACLAALVTPVCLAATENKPLPLPLNLTVPADATSSSSSSSTASTPEVTIAAPAAASMAAGDVADRAGTKPFSAAAIALKFGVGGIGFDLATPLATKLNLRGGAVFFGYSPNITTDGINITGTLTMRTIGASLDYYPWGNAFRISPGLTMYNGNHIAANAVIPGGQSFSLGNGDYTSSTSDPVNGSFDMKFGNKVAPSITLGFGNMLPRKAGQHWSVPFELGVEFIGTPTATLQLNGTACGTDGCQKIASDPTTQANIQAEQAKINSDIAPLKTYPILSIGVSYKFGGHTK